MRIAGSDGRAQGAVAARPCVSWTLARPRSSTAPSIRCSLSIYIHTQLCGQAVGQTSGMQVTSYIYHALSHSLSLALTHAPHMKARAHTRARTHTHTVELHALSHRLSHTQSLSLSHTRTHSQVTYCISIHHASRVLIRGGTLSGANRAAFFAEPGATGATLLIYGPVSLPVRLWCTPDRPGRFESDRVV